LIDESNEWGHSLYKLAKYGEISFKYEEISLKFEILSGGHAPTQLHLGPLLIGNSLGGTFCVRTCTTCAALLDALAMNDSQNFQVYGNCPLPQDHIIQREFKHFEAYLILDLEAPLMVMEK
jgi:hypothetical protein